MVTGVGFLGSDQSFCIKSTLGSFSNLWAPSAMKASGDTDMYHHGLTLSVTLYMSTASPTGRSARTFQALCMQTKKSVFLKHTWNFTSDGLCLEHEIHTEVAEAQAPQVSRLEAFHDLEGQLTRTHEFQSESWVKFEDFRHFRRSQHYRLVLYEFAHPIRLFRNMRELVQAFRDALEGKKPISVSGLSR